MSDVPYPQGGEPDATGGRRRMFNLNVGTQMNVDLPGLDRAQGQISAVTDALRSMKDALRDIGQSGYSLAAGINSMFDSISRRAQEARTQVNQLNTAVGGVGGGGGGGGAPAAPGGGGAPSYVSAAAASASTAVASAGGYGGAGGTLPGGGYAPPAGVSLASSVGAAPPWEKESFARTLALTPLRFMRERMSTNRQTALSAAGAMSLQSFATGVSTQDIMGQLAFRPGQVQGTVQDYLSLMNAAPGYGAMYGWGGQNAPRAAGFLRGVQQAQMMSPMTPVPELAQMIGGQASNVPAQQQGAFLTGGAFSMVAQGGRQKTLSEWAESVMKWLMGLRGGSNRNKMWSYGELIAQYFPGSNIDAWFTANGVSQEMREFWWSYALRKAGTAASEQDRMTIAPEAESVAWNRLQATTETTRTEFGLAGTMAGAYANREQANRWFNQTMGNLMNKILPAATSQGPMSFIQFLPDTIEELLMTILERSGGIGTVAGGALAYSGVTSAALKNVFGSLFDTGDVGDVGDYGELGGSTTAGLHPDLRKKVTRMLQANPKLRITSGLRDHTTQQRLKAKGHSRVSGGPSAHTRGMAVDLGPASEYNWIVRNARKFGLSSGVGVGEPWHVGMGDVEGVGDIWDWLGFNSGMGARDIEKQRATADDAKSVSDQMDIVSAFSNIVKGVLPGGETPGPEAMVGSITSLIQSVLNLLGGVFGAQAKETPDLGALKFQPSLFENLPRQFQLGIFPSQGYVNRNTTPPGSSGPTGPYAPGTPADFYSQDDLTRAKATAVVAHNVAGFSGEDLVKMIAIAGRESSWTPTAHRSDTPGKPDNKGDRGLWQINEIWNDDLTNAGIISGTDEAGSRDLYDANTNARAMKYIFDSQGWTAWTTYNAGLTTEQLNFARQAKDSAGIGDIEAFYAASTPITHAKTAPIVFNNTFNVGDSGRGGIDIRRTVTLMADQLEDEMKKRLVRVN